MDATAIDKATPGSHCRIPAYMYVHRGSIVTPSGKRILGIIYGLL